MSNEQFDHEAANREIQLNTLRHHFNVMVDMYKDYALYPPALTDINELLNDRSGYSIEEIRWLITEKAAWLITYSNRYEILVALRNFVLQVAGQGYFHA